MAPQEGDGSLRSAMMLQLKKMIDRPGARPETGPPPCTPTAQDDPRTSDPSARAKRQKRRQRGARVVCRPAASRHVHAALLGPVGPSPATEEDEKTDA
eukprot:7915695-Pyramimonas_sp.AAC.1